VEKIWKKKALAHFTALYKNLPTESEINGKLQSKYVVLGLRFEPVISRIHVNQFGMCLSIKLLLSLIMRTAQFSFVNFTVSLNY
jgi:hypothetical protein